MSAVRDSRAGARPAPFVTTLSVVVLSLSACVTVPPAGESGEQSSDASRNETSRDQSSGDGADAGADETATTSEERRAVLGRRLDETLDDFDKTLQDEQRRTAEQRDTRTAASREGDGDTGSAERTLSREGDLRSERSTAAESRGDGSESRDRGQAGTGSGAPDRGLPSGDDDDIVARRLRRAAEQETDPELKEKLWKEYADYKRNAQGGG